MTEESLNFFKDCESPVENEIELTKLGMSLKNNSISSSDQNKLNDNSSDKHE